jgi:hypothetical protein
MTTDKREIAQSIRISRKELDILKDRAKKLGLSISNLIRLVMFNYNYIYSDTKSVVNEKTGRYRYYKCSFTGHIDDQMKSDYNNYERYMLEDNENEEK